jgi:hypothetical protein
MPTKASSKQCVIKAEVGEELHTDFTKWAKTEGRSAQRHAAIMLQKLNSLRKTNPDQLASIGLLDRVIPTRI